VPIYARSGIREVWLLDVEACVILVYRDPTPDGFQTTFVAPRGERLSPVALPDHEVAVTDLLG
jgi:Uma2 family endonuclease